MSTKKERQGRAVEGEGNVFPIAAPPFDVGAPRIWVTDLDELVLALRTQESAPDIALVARILRLDGQVDSLSTRSTPTVTNNVASMRLPLYDGWLISVAVHEQSKWITGRTYGILSVGPLNDTSQFDRLILAQGYFTNLSRLFWPGFWSHGSLDGRGEHVVVAVSNPASGANFVEEVPTLQRWRVKWVSYRLQTDATAANRYAGVGMNDGTNTGFRQHVQVATTASKMLWAFFAPGAGSGGVADSHGHAPMPDMLLDELGDVRSIVLNLQSGDSLDNIFVGVERWFEEQS